MLLNKITRLLLLASFFVIYNSCSKSSNGSTSGTCDPNVSFSTQVLPLLNQKCNISGCHNNVSAVSYSTYTAAQSAASLIKSSVVSGSMPRNGSLTATQKSIITCWVDNGAKNN